MIEQILLEKFILSRPATNQEHREAIALLTNLVKQNEQLKQQLQKLKDDEQHKSNS